PVTSLRDSDSQEPAVARAPSAAFEKTTRELLLQKIKDNGVTTLDQVPPLLSKSFASNFTIKHGLMTDENGAPIHGPRGHLAEPDVPNLGMHSEPLSPRAFVFDPYSAFIISYNGGKKADGVTPQQGGEDLDTLSFDFNAKTFQLSKIVFPLQSAGVAPLSTQKCSLCHGENSRPIFSMYPDWPRFYGSDNDELRLGQEPLGAGDPPSDFKGADAMTIKRRDIQLREFAYFHKFKDEVAPHNSRFSPLFSSEAYGVHMFTEPSSTYREYPYRSDVEQPGEELDASSVSRSFTRRAGLRFNLLTSRLLVQQVVRKIETHPRFAKFGDFFVYNLMRCGVEAPAAIATPVTVMQKWSAPLLGALAETEKSGALRYSKWNVAAQDDSQRLLPHGTFTLPVSNGQKSLSLREGGKLLDYGQNLALFDLKINDVDMRFTYYHDAYLPENSYKDLCAGSQGKHCGDQVMHVGYLQKSYFNSYNDGSTTMDEHLTAELLKVLSRSNPELANYLKARG
ncbi:MAG: hypothetical protein K2P92_08100, partial [Bdellovibrionaceae bacterium]|nr:hypothetical protein [Pseudobdellovibrionaceae bacterium]